MWSAEAPFRTALRRRSIRRTTGGFLALTLGEWVFGTTAAIALFGAHGALAVGVVGARFLPAAVASLATGDLADRLSPRLVLASTSAGRAIVAVAALVWIEAGGGLLVLAALVWVDAAIGAAYRPAQARLLPSIARSPAELATAATLVSTAKSAGQILGALAGSVMAAVGGAALGAGVAAALFAIALLAAAQQRTTHTSAAARRAPRGLGMRQGVTALRESPEAGRIAFWSCARALGRGAWTSLGVLAAIVLLHMEETGYGVLMGAAGVGTVLGITLSSRLAARRHLAGPFALALAAPGVAFLLIGAVALPSVALVAMVLWGAGMALADVSAQALLTRVVPPSETGRVTGVMEAAKLFAEGLGGLAAPIAAEVAGLQAAFIVSGVLVLLALALDFDGFRRIDRVAVGRVELLDLARGVPSFRSLRVDGLEALVAPLQTRAVAAGDVVITQDAVGSTWFLVQHGRFGVFVDHFRVGEVGPGGSFGERGLMLAEARTATVRAETDGTVLTLERDDFLRALTGTDAIPTAVAPTGVDPVELLRRQPLLHRASDALVDRLAAGATRQAVDAGATLFVQGELSDVWLVIVAGSVEITVDGTARRVLGPGDALGEIAVLHGVPRTATAVALTDVAVLTIDGATLRDAVELTPHDAGPIDLPEQVGGATNA